MEVEGNEHTVSFERAGDMAQATDVPSAVAKTLLEADDAYEVAGPEEDPDWPEIGNDKASSSEPVSTIDGVGPARTEDLASAGIDTVGALAAADPEAVAASTDLSADDVAEWVGTAKARL